MIKPLSHRSATVLLAPVFILLAFLFVSCKQQYQKGKFKEESEEKDKRTGAREAYERDVLMMKDPSLGYVPADRIIAAKQYKDQLMQTEAALPGVEWNELGPKNQGGRSRTLLVDANDATGNTVWAGSVGGGLWKTTDISAAQPQWIPAGDLLGNLAVTSIAQDPTNPQTMYFSTGEGYFNLDYIRGLGVWKSTNGGITWAQLASTNNTNFHFCQKVLVNSTGVVFVATASGLMRSADGGTTFTKVLGAGLGITGAANNFCYDVEAAANGDIYASLDGSIHKSVNAGATFGAAQALPIAVARVELACAPSDPNYVYALCENGNVVAGILRTVNGGTTWTARTEPADADSGIPATDFSRTQAWYDLSIAVDPLNRDALFVGGIDLFKSTDGAGTWTQVSHWYGGFGYQYVHADQHYVIYKPGSNTVAYFTNDGGVYQTTNANAASPTITDKGANYRTIQFYSCAIHPTAQTNYFLAGAQDNGSHQFTSGTVQNTVEVTGGDGAFCHIDQDQPQYQFTSYVRNDFYRSSDGGSTWTEFATTGGSFISPTDYDDVNNMLYMCNTTGSYRRWNNPQTGNTFQSVNVAEFGGGTVTAVKVSPNTSNRVFFAIDNGRVVRVDNANTASPTSTNISTGLPAAYPACVEVETGNDNHLIVTYTNYGVNSIWESTNGGTTWTSVEGNLPDIPVRWALFNPNNNDQVVIATELGVWSTDNLNGAATVWGASNSGLANVRVDMLQIRQSDKLMIAATHGRGLYYSDAFTSPTALFDADKKMGYTGATVGFTSTSYKGTSWNWNFGDGNVSTAENPSHTYNTAGKYNVTLSINSGASSITKTQYIHILPNKGTPYAVADGGGFETSTDNFGVDLAAGTTWERGNSAVAGKNGTHAGANAWVTGLTGNYADNGEASLLTPNYNFTASGTYTFSFWSKFVTEAGYDGFRVEYSTNKGTTWLPLGTTTGAGWYNFANTLGDAVFPVNEAFFNGTVANYTQYSRDVSFLAGNQNVAFRFRFKSDISINAAGVAIDDVEVQGPANVILPLSLNSFTAVRNNTDALLTWETSNEQQVSRYEIERSTDGLRFTAIGTKPATNQAQNSYNYTDVQPQNAVRDAYYFYYRLRMIDTDNNFKYSNVSRISFDKTSEDITIGPNPFTNYINVFSSMPVKRISIWSAEGKQVFTTSTVSGSQVPVTNQLPAGMYFVRIETTAGVVQRKLMKRD